MSATLHPTDLEAIVTTLEIASIYLTPAPDTRFSYEQLLAQARDLVGEELPLDERDVRIVVDNAKFLRKHPGGSNTTDVIPPCEVMRTTHLHRVVMMTPGFIGCPMCSNGAKHRGHVCGGPSMRCTRRAAQS